MKLIIQNQSELTDIDAIGLVYKVIANGKISENGKSYCYATTFKIKKNKYVVYANGNQDKTNFTIENTTK
jgi:hypothetical protein